LTFLCRQVCDLIFPVTSSVVWHLECVTSVSPYHFVYTLNTGTENPVTQGNDFKDSREQRFKHVSLSNSDTVSLSFENVRPNSDTSVIVTCKHNAEIQDSMPVAWKKFWSLKPFESSDYYFYHMSWQYKYVSSLCIHGSRMNLRIKSDYFCKQFSIVGLYGRFSIYILWDGNCIFRSVKYIWINMLLTV